MKMMTISTQLFTALAIISLCTTVNGVGAENVVRVPQFTKIPIVMESDVSSAPEKTDDVFSATTEDDLIVDGQLIWPKGSKITGKIFRDANGPRHMDRSSSIRLVFDSIQFPKGIPVPLPARFVGHGGVIHFSRGPAKFQVDTGTELSCGPTYATTGSKPQLINGLEPEEFHRSSFLLAKKGKIVDIKVGDITRIQLVEDIKVDVTQSSVSGNE
jgi:hypothetical protein